MVKNYVLCYLSECVLCYMSNNMFVKWLVVLFFVVWTYFAVEKKLQKYEKILNEQCWFTNYKYMCVCLLITILIFFKLMQFSITYILCISFIYICHLNKHNLNYNECKNSCVVIWIKRYANREYIYKIERIFCVNYLCSKKKKRYI